MPNGTPWREYLLKLPDDYTRCQAWLSAEWNTCAVGEQREKYPELIHAIPSEDKRNRPQDDVLFQLGHDFHSAILKGDKHRALEVIDQIEDRVLEMKRTTKVD